MATETPSGAEGAVIPPAALSEPTLEELQADMRSATHSAHQVPEANRDIETTREAGEYVLPPPATKPSKE